MGYRFAHAEIPRRTDFSNELRRSVVGGPLSHYAGVRADEVLRHASRSLPYQEAIRHGEQSWTYEELNHDAVRCGSMLQQIGVANGDRVAVLLPNIPEYVIAVNGIWRCGGVVVALSPLMVAEEIDELLETTDARYVICLDVLSQLVDRGGRLPLRKLIVSLRDRLPAIEQLGYVWLRHQRTGHWAMPTTERSSPFWGLIEQTRREWRRVPIDPVRDPAYIIPTGGTTGHPKAVALSHENLVANAWQQAQWTGGSFGEERLLAALPFFHSYGLSATIMAGAALGASLVLQHRFDARALLELIERERPTVFHAVPAMLVALNERLRKSSADLSSLKWVIAGGSPLPPEVAAEFAEHSGAQIFEGYGLSEASPVTHVSPLSGHSNYGTIGQPLPATEARIVDIESGTEPVPVGEIGELIVRGPQVMLGYWGDPLATAEVIRDGWLHTGDLATIDTAGLYRIVGRKKDLIITSGFNVYPRDVEAVLREAESVHDAAVVGEPDSRCGEIVKAYVVLEPGFSWDPEALHAYCREHLSKHKRPRIFVQCDGDLPRNFLGKVIRRHLRGGAATETDLTPEIPEAQS